MTPLGHRIVLASVTPSAGRSTIRRYRFARLVVNRQRELSSDGRFEHLKRVYD